MINTHEIILLKENEASVFCVADEAALYTTCDHLRPPLPTNLSKNTNTSPSSNLPLNNSISVIYVRRRGALLFCQQDRAILCKECDISIHKANEHTQKHNRFLLTGVKLYVTSALYSSPSSSTSTESSLTNVSDSDSQYAIYADNYSKSLRKDWVFGAPTSPGSEIGEYGCFFGASSSAGEFWWSKIMDVNGIGVEIDHFMRWHEGKPFPVSALQFALVIRNLSPSLLYITEMQTFVCLFCIKCLRCFDVSSFADRLTGSRIMGDGKT
ncbi:B-box zinc finger protein 21 [Forsythia ovata]|uniref:B-box zinc finger protein 21 n=1 Tax=Forsythia ovata TaxID=205694 RepID=A0ABD1VID6_9LAMI